MISLKDNRTALLNLRGTIEALERIDTLIEYYSDPKPGPAYVTFSAVNRIAEVQLDRTIALTALTAQREKLVTYLSTLGIEA